MYADDLVIAAHSEEELEALLMNLELATKRWGLTISPTKTKHLPGYYVPLDTPPPQLPIGDGAVVERVECFPYLGSVLMTTSGLTAEVSLRISRATLSCVTLCGSYPVCHSARSGSFRYSRPRSFPPFSMLVWTPLMEHLCRLETFRLACLRSILGLTRLDYVRSSQIFEICGQSPIGELLRQARLRWLGHVARMPGNRMPKQLLFGRIEGAKRVQHGLEKRWSDVVQEDLELSGLAADWYQQCQDQSLWRRLVKDAAGQLEAVALQQQRRAEERHSQQ
ncbi:cell death activator CIDE-3 isoform X1 [Xyrauchen texanus]|uniref:cell death activator CIDE-3 isoform X1 n=1 Tax=Xyrauchen texanus TaxID=154827 RepID=UPI00224292DD|nr:cell death activator CIDE-3 isoform X1 [Xyrauchen texanus]